MFTVPALIRLCSLYLILLFYSPHNIYAQSSHCDCRSNLEEVITKITKNYPGYSIKITPARKADFRHFTDSLRQLADTATPTSCYPILQQWLNYFKDQHLSIVFKESPENSSFIRSTFATAHSYPLAADSLIKEWASVPPRSLEGLWSAGGTYQVALIQKDNSYLGVVTKADSVFWTPGQIKFELKNTGGQKFSGVLYNRYHIGDSFTTYLHLQLRLREVNGRRFIQPWQRTNFQLLSIVFTLQKLTVIMHCYDFQVLI